MDAVVGCFLGVVMDFAAVFALHTVAFPCEVKQIEHAVAVAEVVPTFAVIATDSHKAESVTLTRVLPGSLSSSVTRLVACHAYYLIVVAVLLCARRPGSADYTYPEFALSSTVLVVAQQGHCGVVEMLG